MRRKSGLSPALFIASGFMGGLAVPDAPALTAPANAAVLDDTTPEFSWQAVPGAVTYDIEIRATLTGTPTATGIAGTTYTPSALDAFTAYSWRVRAVNAVGAGAWSATRTFRFSYALRIQNTQSANLIAYWPLNETSGTNADDVSATNADGTYSGTFTLAQPGIGDGSNGVNFNGANGRVSLATPLTALGGVFSGTQGTLLVWGQIPTAGVWSDGTSDFMVEIGASAGNRVGLYKNNSVANSISGIYNANSVGQFPLYTMGASRATWFVAAITWDKNAGGSGEIKLYVDGTQRDTTKTGLGAWVGSLSASWTALADSTSSGGGSPWNGNLAHVAIWNVALSPTQVSALATP